MYRGTRVPLGLVEVRVSPIVTSSVHLPHHPRLSKKIKKNKIKKWKTTKTTHPFILCVIPFLHQPSFFSLLYINLRPKLYIPCKQSKTQTHGLNQSYAYSFLLHPLHHVLLYHTQPFLHRITNPPYLATSTSLQHPSNLNCLLESWKV